MDDIAKMHYCETHKCWYEEECLACFYERKMVDLLAEKEKNRNRTEVAYVIAGFLMLMTLFILIGSL
jgi:hypothetical protein